MAIIDAQSDVPSFIHTLHLCFLWSTTFYLREISRFIKTLVPLRQLEYLQITCEECCNQYGHFDCYSDPSNHDFCSTLPHLFRMPSIIELDLGSLYDPNLEILISLLTTHSRLTKLKLENLSAVDSQNVAIRKYPTGSIHTLILGEDCVFVVDGLATNCGTQMFDSIKHLVFENSHVAIVIEDDIDSIRQAIHTLSSTIPHFTWDPTASYQFPESHVSIDLHNHPSSKCLTLNFIPAPLMQAKYEEEDDNEINRFNFIVFGLLYNAAAAVTIDELNIWFHDGCFESGFVDRIPPSFWT
ncbi:hypothetical protein BDQ12DRAFT_66211 [Crucibulum laeve]|uniref:Uncharacterized protein n=1 Tax=Crucibulum laeve TaxID=68775 RepID=A0A5C3LJA0_9AGAR|nr:hypothetical protein BDQ12DRAFT_66211 [Crucibulum laeve]